MPELPPLTLDVRPLFASQRAPLPAIMNALGRLAPGQAFLLIAPLEPVPLITRLQQRGFTAQVQQRPDGDFEVLFRPEET